MRCQIRNIAVLAAALIVQVGCTSTVGRLSSTPALSATDVTGGINSPTIPSKDQFPSQRIHPNSTWDDRSANMFLNKRAANVGDILTVQISLNDNARFSNQSNRKRTGSKSLGLNGSFDIAGAGTSGSLDASLEGETAFNGNGGVSRSESINVRVAALVHQVLPTGNLYISGSQEVLVNSELRFLTITGIIRPSDILPDNTIGYERIAEARISYGGRGRISEIQQPAYGQQILDRLSPL